jgi:arylformamidase
MSEVDLEAGYDARARVPEHPAIFARWLREAAAYRAGRACTPDLVYGDGPGQALDLFAAGGGARALFVHGGWWRAMDRKHFSHMARGLNLRGIGVAVAGYDLCPKVSIAEIERQIRRACRFLGGRIVVFGHSAGGHLAACVANEVAAGYAISGLFDLEPLVGLSMNADWRLDAAQARALSPVHRPAPASFDAVVGALESDAFKRQSLLLAEKWGARYEEIEGANHFTVLDPLADPHSAMVARLADICARTAS